MAIDWDMYFDEDDYYSSGGSNNMWMDDTWNTDDDTYQDWGYADDYYWDATPEADNADAFYENYVREIPDRWDTSFGGQANKYTGVGTLLGNLKSGAGEYTKKGSFLGGLLGGKDGVLGGKDLMQLGGGLAGSWLQDRDNKRYNEMQQPLTDLYKAQAADVAKRRANRDANIASEYDSAIGMMQPDWDRRDQRAANLAQAQGVTQSSSNAWNQAANEQRRDNTKLATQQSIANRYDERTGVLGGQLRGLNPWSEQYGQAQQNPYLNTGIRGLMGV
jgi:hypothetical protein